MVFGLIECQTKLSNPIGDPERSTIRDTSLTLPGWLTDRLPWQSTTVPYCSAFAKAINVRWRKSLTAMAGRCIRSLCVFLKDTGHAEDVMQEIFFQVWRNSDSFVQGRGSLGAWLVVIARNRSIDLLRRRKPTDSVEDVVLASSTNLASEVEHNAMMEKVQKVLQGLPAEQQRSMELAFFEGLSHSEIAARTGDPLGTVKTRIRLALITLRKAFQVMTGNGHNTQEELASYAMQNLPVEESASIRAHLQSCATCRNELAQVCGDLALLGLVGRAAAAARGRS